MFLEVSFFGSSIRQYIVALALLVVTIAVGKAFYWVSTKLVRSFTAKTKTRLDDILLNVLEKPILFLIAQGGIRLGLSQLTLPFALDKTIDSVMVVLFILNACWVFINLFDAILVNYIKPYADKSRSRMDDTLVIVVGRVAKILMWLIALIIIITNFGYDVSALLAGLGLGGLAFALAAQDLLSNLFGGAAILTDRPFKIGDRIRWGANDGFVRDIGLRTTRIETLDGTMLVVPNAELAKTAVENVSKEKARKVTVKLGLEYNTSNKKIKQAEDILKGIAKKHKALLDDSAVGFSDFGDFALIVTFVYWVKDPTKLMDIKSEVNLEIKERFEKAGLEFAYPTQNVILSKQGRKK